MNEPAPHIALTYQANVTADGRINLDVPLPAGTPVLVFVVEQSEEHALADLLDAARSSTHFWDNPYDDEDWNNA